MTEPWLLGFGGERIALTQPDLTPIRTRTIANVLARVPRFGGHALTVNVARHSVFVAWWVLVTTGSREQAAMALVHDAHEAYTGDMPSPVKELLGDAWRPFEASWRERVLRAYGYDPEHPAWGGAIHDADLIARAWERRRYMPPAPAYDADWSLSEVFVDPATAGEVYEKSGLRAPADVAGDTRRFLTLARELGVRSHDD